jgi:hypothetical protein
MDSKNHPDMDKIVARVWQAEHDRERRLDFVRKCILEGQWAGQTVEDVTQKIVDVWDAEARVLGENAIG